MTGIRTELDNMMSNRQGDGRSASSSVRMIIWTGLYLDSSKEIKKSKGYDKETRTVMVAPKDRFNAFIQKRWRPEAIDPVITKLKRSLNIEGGKGSEKEILERTPSSFAGVGEPSIGPIEAPKNSTTFEAPAIDLWMELAFFDIEVTTVELAPNEGLGLDRAAPGGIVDPRYCEIEVPLTMGGKIMTVNARLVRNGNIDPSNQLRTPRGGGEPLREYRRKRSLATTINGTNARITQNLQNFNSKYSGSCNSQQSEIQLDGDVWLEGIRTSLTRGIYEVWTDDIRMGPMLRISRQKVQEASARYTRMTAAAQVRYATQRDHPAGGDIASTAISPIKIYIDDWFGDPGLYTGLANFLMQIATSLDNNGNKVDYNKTYYDAGVTDYSKIYNKYDGVKI